MIHIALKTGKSLFVVKQNRFNPPVQAVKKLIDENRFYLGIETEELTMPFAIKTVGNKPFLYSSDFPHEVTHESCKHDIGELLESDEITEDDKAAMLWRNAETFYKLPL